MLLYFYREIYNVYNGNTQLCDIHYFIIKRRTIMAKEFIEFKENYEDLMKYATKQLGRVLQDQEEFDMDELYGMYTVIIKKTMDLSNSAMELVEYQTNCLEKIKLETAKAAGEREAIAKYLTHLDTKLDGLDNKLNKFGDTINGLRKEKVEKK